MRLSTHFNKTLLSLIPIGDGLLLEIGAGKGSARCLLSNFG